MDAALARIDGRGPAPAPETAQAAAPAPEDAGQLAARVEALIDVYFAAHQSDERELVFEQLWALGGESVRDFAAAMLEHDQDEAMRLSAALCLAEAGDRRGQQALLGRLDDPNDLDEEQAAAALAALAGAPAGAERAASYDRVARWWRDGGAHDALRQRAMATLAALDRGRAWADFAGFIAQLAAAAALEPWPERQLDEALMALAAWGRHEALPQVQALAGRLAHLPAEDDRRLQVEAGLELIAKAAGQHPGQGG